MNYKQEGLIQTAIMLLTTSGVVPIDIIYKLTSQGIDYSALDAKYNINN